MDGDYCYLLAHSVVFLTTTTKIKFEKRQKIYVLADKNQTHRRFARHRTTTNCWLDGWIYRRKAKLRREIGSRGDWQDICGHWKNTVR